MGTEFKVGKTYIKGGYEFRVVAVESCPTPSLNLIGVFGFMSEIHSPGIGWWADSLSYTLGMPNTWAEQKDLFEAGKTYKASDPDCDGVFECVEVRDGHAIGWTYGDFTTHEGLVLRQTDRMHWVEVPK